MKDGFFMYRQFLEACPDAVLLVPADAVNPCFTDVNKRAVALYGYSLDEFRHLHLSDLQQSAEPVSLSADTSPLHGVHLSKEAVPFPVEIHISSVDIDDREFYQLIVRDLSHEVELFKALRFSQEYFRTAFHASPDSININRLSDGVFIKVNAGFTRIMGYQPDEVLGRSSLELNIWKDEGDRQKLLARVAQTGIVENLEARFVAKDGSIKHGLMSARVIDMNDEKVILSITRDITERRHEQEELRRQSIIFEKLTLAAKDGIVLLSPEGEVVFWNPGAVQIFGYSAEEMLGRNLHRILAPEPYLSRFLDNFPHFVNTGEGAAVGKTLELKALHKSGEMIDIELSVSAFELDGSFQAMAIVRDVTTRKNQEEEMALLHFAIEHTSEEVHLVSASGQLMYVNRAACRSLGYERSELIGMMITDIAPRRTPEVWTDHWQELEKRKVISLETVQQRKDGSLYPVWVTANYFEYGGNRYNLAMILDLTEIKRQEEEKLQLERQMVQTQKLESLGVLAGGVAHDFNNLLAAIMGHAELTKRRLPEGSKAIDNLLQIEQAAARAADLARQMLAYSGRGKFVIETIDLNQVLQEILQMLKVSIPKNVSLRFEPHFPLPGIDADATQIRQIIMNLVINAAEAIGNNSGTISIATGSLFCDQECLKKACFNENLEVGPYVYLEVADTGCGMDEATQARLFDPFFTTKFTGRGLGMSAVMGIIRGHKGAISVRSSKGEGTVFRVLFPASQAEIQGITGAEPVEDWRGSGTVLLVDDEAAVRGICRQMLEELGFDVLVADDGKEALEIFIRHPEIVLVLLDLTMPNMDGISCLTELRNINSQTPVILSSGYNESEIVKKFGSIGVAGFVQKPYRLGVLTETISRLFH